MGDKAILLLESAQNDQTLVEANLPTGPYRLVVTHSTQEAEERLGGEACDVLIADCSHSNGDISALLQWMKGHATDVPVILLCEPADEDWVRRLTQSFACEWVSKSPEALPRLKEMVADASQRHEAQRRTALLDQMVQSSMDAILALDMEGRVTAANPAAETVFGYHPDEVQGESIAQLFQPGGGESSVSEMLSASLGGLPWRGNLTGRRKDGLTLPIQAVTSPQLDAAGAPRGVIVVCRDASERYELLERVKQLSITDPLTGLFNHRYFHDRLHYEFMRARRYDQSLTCIMMDVDYFKMVNDTYGHLVGDETLRALATTIRQAVRSTDIVARYGGEEFAVVLPNTEMAGARRCAENVWEAAGTRQIPARHGELQLTLSLGVAALTPDVQSEEELLRRADVALLTAKRRGRNTVCVWDGTETNLESAEATLEVETTAELRENVHRLIAPAKARYLEAARVLLESLSHRMPQMRRHALNVAIYAMELARMAAMDADEEDALQRAALFHDLGYSATPPELFSKPGPLTAEERKAVQVHPKASEALLAELCLFQREAGYVRHHHERFDGSGYPDGLAGDQIPLGARVLAVADAYEAMMSPRPYRDPLTPQEALAELERQAGSQFDARLVRLFVESRKAGLRRSR